MADDEIELISLGNPTFFDIACQPEVQPSTILIINLPSHCEVTAAELHRSSNRRWCIIYAKGTLKRQHSEPFASKEVAMEKFRTMLRPRNRF
jgi:hypothetical protein